MSSLDKLSSWKNIENHSKNISEKSLNDLFNMDKDRFNKFSIQEKNLLLDFSKNHIDDKMMKLFSDLLYEIDIKGKITDLFNGEKINTSENRSVLHFLLRGSYNSKTKELYDNNVKKNIDKLKIFSRKFENGEIKVSANNPEKEESGNETEESSDDSNSECEKGSYRLNARS